MRKNTYIDDQQHGRSRYEMHLKCERSEPEKLQNTLARRMEMLMDNDKMLQLHRIFFSIGPANDEQTQWMVMCDLDAEDAPYLEDLLVEHERRYGVRNVAPGTSNKFLGGAS